MTKALYGILVATALVTGLAFRLVRLDARPMHHDEANQAVKFGALRGPSPGEGACQGLYTANTMACLTETMGMSLPGCATAIAGLAKKRHIGYATGQRIVELVRKNVTARKIMTRAAFENAIRVDVALGGSSNTVLHLLAIAREAGVDLPLSEFDRIARETPQLTTVTPVGPDLMEDVEPSRPAHQLGHLDLDSPEGEDQVMRRG